jgi:hypothetical protein
MPETENYQPSKTTLYLNDLQTTLFFELGTDEDTVGGPMLMPMCYTVNFFKGFTFVWVVALMLYFQNYSKAMILYLCLHGTYGFCWVIKDFVFPDARAQKMGTVCSHVLLFTLLVFYWMIPIPLAMSLGNQNPSILSMCLYVVVYLTGLVLMMGSDYQKYHSLKVKKGKNYKILRSGKYRFFQIYSKPQLPWLDPHLPIFLPVFRPHPLFFLLFLPSRHPLHPKHLPQRANVLQIEKRL